MSDKKYLPYGIEDFARLIRKNCYYVDKTSFIKKVFGNDQSTVLLITRPRRFGKTLMLSTFANFLGMNLDDPSDLSTQKELFANTEVIKDQPFCHEFMGRFPVVFISFKDVWGENYKLARSQLAYCINMLASNFAFLEQSPKLTTEQKARFKKLLQEFTFNEDDEEILRTSLLTITILLEKHFERKVILLIDEYDVPLDKAEQNGYYKQMLNLMRSMLSSVLKTNLSLEKAVLTGCLRISKESIFTGLNNLAVNTVCSENVNMSSIVGFTQDEASNMLSYYDLNSYEDAVKQWYDGYRFAGNEIFCPWDVVNFCYDAVNSIRSEKNKISLQNYWAGTSSNDAICDFMPYLDEREAKRMQTLINGGEIEISLNEQLNYNAIKKFHDPDDFWTLLLYTGYLTIAADQVSSEPSKTYKVRIPNAEIIECFKSNITQYYQNNSQIRTNALKLIQMLIAGYADDVANSIEDLLSNYVSVRDFASKAAPENYYHGFLNGLFSALGNNIDEYHSNFESGDGYADITFSSKKEQAGIVIELKSTKDINKLDSLAKDALQQIEDKNYMAGLNKRRLKKINCYGLAFCHKYCAIAVKVINL